MGQCEPGAGEGWLAQNIGLSEACKGRIIAKE
jgi:hypothetical protein